MTFIISSPAKINLFLKIGEKDGTGYHKIETVMARHPGFSDMIEINKSNNLQVECGDIPSEKNLITKAVKIVAAAAGRPLQYSIKVEKKIPLCSGFGGASSNAAATIIFLNEHESLGFSHKELMRIGAKLGMDVPFFLSGHNVAFCTNYGEKVEWLPDLPEDLEIELHYGSQKSTSTAYMEWDKKGEQSEKDSRKIIEAIQKGDSNSIIRELHNDFQTLFPLDCTSSHLSHPSSGFALLSGSGGGYAVFRVKEKTT